MQNFIDVNAGLVGAAGDLAVQYTQEIPDGFLRDLSDDRDASITTPAGEFHRVCAVPVATVNKWLREGFNIYDNNVTAEDIVARLKREHLDAFLATRKRI